MNKFVALCLVSLVFLLPVWAQDNPLPVPVSETAKPTNAIDLSTPEKAVQSFLEAFSRLDMKSMTACILGASYSPAAQQLERELRAQPTTAVSVTLGVTLLDVVSDIRGDTATVKFRMKSDPSELAIPKVENIVSLARDGSDWKLVAESATGVLNATPDDLRGRKGTQLMVELARYPDVLLNARDRIKAAASLSKMRQLGKICIWVAEDSKGIYLIDPAKLMTSLTRYVGDKDVVRSPLDPSGTMSYKFNPKLAGKAMKAIRDPERTVMLYEGEWQKPLFRNDGKAVIVFADGSAGLLTPEDAKKMLWQPLPSQPAKPAAKKAKTRRSPE